MAIGLMAISGLWPGSAARAQLIGSPREPQVSVTGRAEVEIMPDTARITLGIENHDASAAKAKAAVDRAADGILAVCAALEIGKDAIEATELSVSPEYDERSNVMKQIGSVVSRSITIRLAVIGKLDELIRRSLEAGATEIEDVSMESSKETDLRREALAKAIADARTKAQFIAIQFGVELGRLESASTEQGSRRTSYSQGFAVEYVTVRSEAATPLIPGPIKFVEEISASFFIK